MGNFKQLVVWQKARSLAIDVYQMTIDYQQLSNDFGLKDQVRRAAISIVSNIAEGDESGSNKQSVRYFNIAKGSAAELITQLDILSEIGFIEKQKISAYVNRCQIISAMLHKLIQIRINKK